MMEWTKERILELLDRKDYAVGRAVVAIYNRQTLDEQQTDRTRHLNGRGFNGVDAEILSSFARQFESRGFLTDKQLLIARKKIRKYVRQLVEVANLKAGKEGSCVQL